MFHVRLFALLFLTFHNRNLKLSALQPQVMWKTFLFSTSRVGSPSYDVASVHHRFLRTP